MIIVSFIPGMLSFNNKKIQSADNISKTKISNLIRNQQDSITFTSNELNNLDINDDKQLTKYMHGQLGEQADLTFNSFLLLPDFLGNIRNFLQQIPDFEKNPPNFKFITKYTSESENEGDFILIGTPKNSKISTQIWSHGFEEINDPFEMIARYEETLLATFDKDNHDNIHKGIKQFFERNIYSQKEDLIEDELDEEVRIYVNHLNNFLLENSTDKTFVSFLNSKSPEQVDNFLITALKTIRNEVNEYNECMDLMEGNNNKWGIKNVIKPLFNDELFRSKATFWMKTLEEDPKHFSLEQAIKRLIEAYHNEDEEDLLIEKTIDTRIKSEYPELYVR